MTRPPARISRRALLLLGPLGLAAAAWAWWRWRLAPGSLAGWVQATLARDLAYLPIPAEVARRFAADYEVDLVRSGHPWTRTFRLLAPLLGVPWLRRLALRGRETRDAVELTEEAMARAFLLHCDLFDQPDPRRPDPVRYQGMPQGFVPPCGNPFWRPA